MCAEPKTKRGSEKDAQEIINDLEKDKENRLSNAESTHYELQPKAVLGYQCKYPKYLIFIEGDAHFLKRKPRKNLCKDDLRNVTVISLSCFGRLDEFEDIDNLYLNKTVKFSVQEMLHAATIYALLWTSITYKKYWGDHNNNHDNNEDNNNKKRSYGVGVSGLVKYTRSALYWTEIIDNDALQNEDGKIDWESEEVMEEIEKSIDKHFKNAAMSAVIDGGSKIAASACNVAPLLPKQINLYQS